MSTGQLVGPGAAWRRHWPEYLIEAWALGMFMVSASAFTTLLEYPHSPLRQAIANADLRRLLIGIAMGVTAIALIYSPWGRRSGAHMNPAVTLSFWRLGKIGRWDALFYIVAQFVGGTLGVLAVRAALQEAFTAAPVSYITTLPGTQGSGVALIAEFAISALMMWTVLQLSASTRYARYTGLCAGALVALYITVEAPFSGMSMNPARSFASAWPAAQWHGFWIYLIAPVLGMQAAAAWQLQRHQRSELPCAKLAHNSARPCIHCGHPGVAA
ncbi:MAG: aquaporin [Steroidobacteraceae bacterium]